MKKLYKIKKSNIDNRGLYAATNIKKNTKNLKTKKKKITIRDIKKNLFTKNTPDPELLIRTGNTKRKASFSKTDNN